MKEKLFSTVKTVLFLCLTGLLIASCDREEAQTQSQVNNEEGTDLSTIDFSNYFQQSECLLQNFWKACDKAYNTDSEAFLTACTTNNLSAFLEATGLTQLQLDEFKEIITKEREALEKDYPGISEEYYESSCQDCQQDALSRIGNIEQTHNGQVSASTPKANAKMCIFICSMACMTTLELYLPCLAACSTTCLKI